MMKIFSWFPLTALASACLAASASAQKTVPPPVEAPAFFKNSPNARPGKTSDVPVPATAPAGPWWSIFHDRTLDDLERAATSANQDLRQSVLRIEEARQQTRNATASYLPTVEANLSAERVRTTNSNPVGRAQIVGNAGAFGALLGNGNGNGNGQIPAFASRGLSATFNDFKAPLTVSYELDVFGRIRHSVTSARAIGQAAEADRRAVELGLSAEVATTYYTLRALDSQIAVFRRGMGLRRDAVRLSQERLNAGVSGPLDLARARVEQDNTEAGLDEAVRQRAETENNLAALCGEPASTFHLAVRLLDETLPPVVPPGLPMQLLARRPDLIEAERRLASANEDIGVAKANFLPTFSIRGNAGQEAAYAREFFDADSRALSVIGEVHVPIFEGGRNVAQLAAARVRRDAALAAYRGTAITAYKEVETALSDLRQRAVQADARHRANADAAQVFQLSQERYLAGATNYFDVVDAQRTMLGAELNGVETLQSRFVSTIALVRAVGGGWAADGAAK